MKTATSNFFELEFFIKMIQFRKIWQQIFENINFEVKKETSKFFELEKNLFLFQKNKKLGSFEQ